MKYTLAAFTLLAGTALAVPTATAFPSAAGETALPTAKVISGTFDGKMVRYSRNRTYLPFIKNNIHLHLYTHTQKKILNNPTADTCAEQTETDEAAAMFIAEDGAVIKNVILSKAQAEGIHCRGACTLENVWWEDVCEDAATFKQPAGKTSYVIGGGAKGASDKIFQFNGRGTVSIKNFYAEDYGKLIRSCGDCTANGGPRNIIIDGVTAKDGGVLCGINTNYGGEYLLVISPFDMGCANLLLQIPARSPTLARTMERAATATRAWSRAVVARPRLAAGPMEPTALSVGLRRLAKQLEDIDC